MSDIMFSSWRRSSGGKVDWKVCAVFFCLVFWSIDGIRWSVSGMDLDARTMGQTISAVSRYKLVSGFYELLTTRRTPLQEATPLWWLSISGYTLTLQFALKSFAARQGICAYIVVSESRLTFSTEKDTRSDKKFLRTEPNSSSLHRVTLCWLLSLRSSKVCFILWSISVVSRCCWWCVTARNKSNKSNHRRQGFETRRPHGSKEVNGYNVGGVSVEVRGSSLDTNEKLWALVETCGCLWNPCQMLLDTNLTLWDFPHCTVKSFLRS